LSERQGPAWVLQCLSRSPKPDMAYGYGSLCFASSPIPRCVKRAERPGTLRSLEGKAHCLVWGRANARRLDYDMRMVKALKFTFTTSKDGLSR